MAKWLFAFALLHSVSPAFADRDPRQVSVFVSDFDGTFARNLANVKVKLGLFPGIPGLGVYSGLPKIVYVPEHDFDGNTGARIRDLLGRYNGLKFIIKASVDEIELQNGSTIRPGYYYVDPNDMFEEFFSTENGEDGHLINNIRMMITGGKRFLLEGSAFVGSTFSQQQSELLKLVILTKRGHSSQEMRYALNFLSKYYGWGEVDHSDSSYVNLSHPDFAEFSMNKEVYLQALYDELSQRTIRNKSTPHFLVYFENDRSAIFEAQKKLKNLGQRGLYANPVVPVLINLVEPEVFNSPHGLDWDRSRLQTFEPMWRVNIYWPERTETTNNLARVFELTLNLSPKKAKAHYREYENTSWCCNILAKAKK